MSLAGTDTVVGMLSVVTPIEVVGFVVVSTEEPLVKVTTAIPVLVNVDTVEMVDHTSTTPELAAIRSRISRYQFCLPSAAVGTSLWELRCDSGHLCCWRSTYGRRRSIILVCGTSRVSYTAVS